MFIYINIEYIRVFGILNSASGFFFFFSLSLCLFLCSSYVGNLKGCFRHMMAEYSIQ